MLTLGIAANVVVFGLVDGLFLRLVPLPGREHLVYINDPSPTLRTSRSFSINYGVRPWGAEPPKLFDGLTLYDGEKFDLSDGPVRRVDGADGHARLRRRPRRAAVLGRSFTPRRRSPDAARVVAHQRGRVAQSVRRGAGRARTRARALS